MSDVNKQNMESSCNQRTEEKDSFNSFCSALHSINKGLESFINTLLVVGQSLKMIENACGVCKNNQWVIYHQLPEEVLVRLNEDPGNCNAIMLDYHKKSGYKNFKQLYAKYKDNTLLSQQHKVTLKQAYDSIYEGKHNTIAYSLTAIFDSILAKVAGEDTHKFLKRLDRLPNTESNIVLDSFEIEDMTFVQTVEAINRFCKISYFDKDPEPAELNRHWIMHGRSSKQFTEVDCLKLFGFIFALLYVSGYQEREGA